MRKTLSFLLITTLLLGFYSCNNDEWEFPDFDYTTTYFPYQYPVRTLVLGKYNFDNNNDNNLKFVISARVGGMYSNKSNVNVEYVVDPTLVDKLTSAPNLFDGKATASADTFRILPEEYYTLSPSGNFVIPKGEFDGGVTVQLTEAFLNDPRAVKTTYVLPLKIVSSTTDSVLLGKTTVSSADPRIPGQWVVAPKNFTIFGIKYVNEYHGKYLHRGRSVISQNGTPVDTIVYRQKYVEKDEVWSLQTAGRNEVTVTGTLRKLPQSPGKFKMKLTFDGDKNCTITTADGSAFNVTGTGEFVNDGDKWGGVAQDAIHLNYTVTEGAFLHQVTDTLVFRDKAVGFIEYTPVVTK
jgi:hypothetical protein